MNQPSVTFETTCWENDWSIMLKTGRLKKMIERCGYPFKERKLLINNVKNRARVLDAARLFLDDGTLTGVIFVDDLADKAVESLGLDIESVKPAYYYSIQDYVGIYDCRTDYLLHFTSDAIMGNRESWIKEAIIRMESDSTVFAANAGWESSGKMAASESDSQDGKFYGGFGFSDQCYLVRAADLKKPIYNEKNAASERYPGYGGEPFEKRIDAYMRNHGLKRITSQKAYYIHRDFSRNPVKKAFQYAFEAVRQ